MAAQPVPSSNRGGKDNAGTETMIPYLPQQSCSGCWPLSFNTIVEAPSIVRAGIFREYNRHTLNEELQNEPPILLTLESILQSQSKCPLCRMIYLEIHGKIGLETTYLAGFRCVRGDELVQSVWIFEPPIAWQDTPLVQLYCHARDGKSSPSSLRSLLPAAKKLARNVRDQVLPLPSHQSSSVRNSHHSNQALVRRLRS